MRRFSRLLLLALVAIVIGFYPLLAPTPHRIDQEHFDLIQEGMMKADVEAIFGVPAGNFDWAEPDSPYLLEILYFRAASAAYREFEQRQLTEVSVSLPERVSDTWLSRHGAFTVQFDTDNRVAGRSGTRGVRIVPPWQRWWKAIWER
jgi:hypothetical protein